MIASNEKKKKQTIYVGSLITWSVAQFLCKKTELLIYVQLLLAVENAWWDGVGIVAER